MKRVLLLVLLAFAALAKGSFVLAYTGPKCDVYECVTVLHICEEQDEGIIAPSIDGGTMLVPFLACHAEERRTKL